MTTTVFEANDLPTRVTLFHDESTVLAGNAIAVTIDTGQEDNFFARQNASANGDSFTQSVFLRAGTYIFSVLGQTNVGNAKIDWYIADPVVPAVSGQDWYSGVQTKNVVKTASVTIPDDGYYVVRGLINGRNAANVTAWNLDLTKIWLRQAAD